MELLNNPTFFDRTNLQHEWLLDWDWVDTEGSINLTATNITYNTAPFWYVSEISTFNGSSSSFANTTAQSIWVANAFTVSTWVDFTTTWTFDNITYITPDISSPRTSAIYTYKDNAEKFTIRLYNSSWTEFKRYITGSNVAWKTHLVFTWNWTSLLIYVDGVDVTSSATKSIDNAWTMTDSNRKVYIGSDMTTYHAWDIWLVRVFSTALSQSEIKNLYQEWLRRFWPTNLLFNNTDFSKYSLANLRDWLVLDISKAQYTTNTYADQSGNWNTWTATNTVDTALWLNNTMQLTSWTLSWSSITFSTSACWEEVSWKWELQINPAYITSTWIASTTKKIANIMLWNRVLSSIEEKQLFYASFIW